MIFLKEGHYLCVLGIFDEATNEKFNELDAALRAEGLRSLGHYRENPWHFSLGVYHGLEIEELVPWVKESAKGVQEITLRFNHIGIFPGVLFIEPAFSWPLRLFFERLHDKYDDLYGSYIATARRYGLFTPHVSMIFTKDEMVKAADALMSHFTPFYGTMSELLVYEYVRKKDKVFPVKPVASIRLSQPDKKGEPDET